MPELPEVQTVVTTLRPRLVGKKIRAIRLLRPDIVRTPGIDLPRRLRGRSIAGIERRAKRIVFTLDDGGKFYIHLGMSGRLTVERAREPVVKHTHLLLDFSADCQLRFRDPRRFGGIWWMSDEDDAGESRLGPEPLTLRPAALARRLAGSRRPIKNALLDQSVIAGLGNIYVDEALFAAKIHPLTPASALSPGDVKTLNRSIKTTLRRALRRRGSTLRDYVDAEGGAGTFQLLHQAYGRTGERCRRCRNPIERIVLGGRSTHFCRHCQPAPTAKN